MISLALGFVLLVPTPQETPATPPPSIWDRLKIEAEGRMRGEATVDAVDASPGTNVGMEIDDRYRGRMRFRLGAKYNLLESVNLGARFSTASDASGGNATDANNPHWDFGDGDGFSGANMVLDRYYLDWSCCPDVHVVFGKQPHAFAVPPIYGDFLWDSDISPAGISATWKPKAEGDFSFDARLAGYVATEVTADEDPKLWGAQGNVFLKLGSTKLQNSAALYDWGDTQDFAVAGNQGNSATTKDFRIFEDFVTVAIPGGSFEEISAYLQFMHNLGESESGIVAGVQLGASNWKRGNFNVFLLGYALDGDSVFSPVAQDDTPIAGTGLNDGDGDGMGGVIVGGTYYLRDNVALKLWALTSNPEGAEDTPARLRLDLDFKIK
jgi:hypothetical protein